MELHKMKLTLHFHSNSHQNTKLNQHQYQYLTMHIKGSKYLQFLQILGNLYSGYGSIGFTDKKYYALLC